MKPLFALSLLAFVMASPRLVRAADPVPGPTASSSVTPADACKALVTKLQTECKPKNDAIKLAQEERNMLRADPQKKEEFENADTHLKRLQDEAGVCTGVADDTPQTCEQLGSLLGIYVQTTNASPLQAAQTARGSDNKHIAETLPVEIQADRQTSMNKGGTDAQADPVESIQPITLVGGAVTLSGTSSGTKGVGTITVNPLAIIGGGAPVSSRMLDLTVSAPFDLDDGTSQDNRYVSGRLRANFTAPISATRLETAYAKMTTMLKTEGKFSNDLTVIISEAHDVKGCVENIIKTKVVTAEACDQGLDGKPIAQARKDLLQELKDARREADSYYAGLDIRFDTGDPTGTARVGDKGTHLLGGLAAGKRFEQSALWDIELRGRFAGDYFKSRDAAAGDDKEPIWSIDWGAAFILSGRTHDSAKQRLAFGIGVEGRQAANLSDAKRELAPTNYANLNLMVVVPVATGGDLGLAFSIPIKDTQVPRGAMVILSTDLGLLDHAH